jgi:hypothetical protein
MVNFVATGYNLYIYIFMPSLFGGIMHRPTDFHSCCVYIPTYNVSKYTKVKDYSVLSRPLATNACT